MGVSTIYIRVGLSIQKVSFFGMLKTFLHFHLSGHQEDLLLSGRPWWRQSEGGLGIL